MSWDADLYERDEGHSVLIGEWNYTHNTSRMIYTVLATVGWDFGERETGYPPEMRPCAWWDNLNAMSGTEGEKYLGLIVSGFMEAPELFRSMNPENGWGDYDSLLDVLVKMRDCSAEFPAGEWEASG